MWTVVWCAEAARELNKIGGREAVAVRNAIGKLEALGPGLPFPHQSAIADSVGLRELRPRAGRSVVRPLYARDGDRFIVGAIAPEAEVDARGFRRAIASAHERIEEFLVSERRSTKEDSS